MKNEQKSIFDLTIKEALFSDYQELKLRTQVLVDPAPMPFIPATPIVAGIKVFNYAKKIATSIVK